MKILIIDNYDSFTYNLYQYLGEILIAAQEPLAHPPRLKVIRNDEMTLAEIAAFMPTHIVISPGPGSPEDAAYFGVCADVILQLGQKIPVLGVCLGMQGIAMCFGGKVVRAPVPVHGKVSPVQHSGEGVFLGLPQGLEVMRYHSLMVQAQDLPDCLAVTAVVSERKVTLGSGFRPEPGDIIMGVRHKNYPIEGIQFHPESFATEGAKDLLRNFLKRRHA